MEDFKSMLCLFFQLIIGITSLPLANAQPQPPYMNISLGSSLSSLDNQSFWTSPSGEFSFGFSTFGCKLYIGIWFDKIPGKPLVWTANRDNPAPNGSTVDFTTDGRLLLKDERKVELMTIANSSDGIVNSAAMLDNGNFVLQSSSGEIKWQSFDHPTDTILPGQSLGPESAIYAAASDTDISTGKFFLKMKNDGNLVVSWINSPADVSNDAYSLGTGGSPATLVFNTSGIIHNSISNGTIVNLTTSGVPEKGFYQRATIGYDGVFRHYSFSKNDNGSSALSWRTVWSTSKDGDPCSVPGICGMNGYCQVNNKMQTDCLCPKGFDYINPSNRFMGCQPNFSVQQCAGLTESDYTIERLANLDWPFGDFAQFDNIMDEGTCREACLSDCLCTVAIFRINKCWKKKIPLYNGKADPSLNSMALIKIPKENNSVTPLPNNGGRDGKVKCRDPKTSLPITILLCLIIGGSGFLNLLCLFLLAFLRRHWLQSRRIDPRQSALGINLRSFTCKELEDATCGFREQLGRGSFGSVYKGVLSQEDGQKLVAVKQLDELMEDGEKEFRTEVSVIGRTHHKNLVQLLGYCDEGSQRMLVYEYLEHGSLSCFLFGRSRPSWEQRVEIIFGVARGISYLHEECSSQIIHCDIKPENILLDHNFVPKISDFGLAKLLMSDQSHTYTNIRGTKGYMASEWFRNIVITAKVDVYSFGVILLEIICCRKNLELNKKDEESAILVYWASDCFTENRLDMLVENDEAALNDMIRVEKMVMVALWCTQEDPSVRPTMKKVVQMLEGAVDVEVPPCPSSFVA